MKRSKDDIAEVWASESRIFWTGKHFRVDHDHLIPKKVVRIDTGMHALAKTRGDQFKLVKTKWGRTVLRCSPAVLELMECARTCDTHLVRTYLLRHKFSPYFEAFERHIWRIQRLRDVAANEYELDRMNRWIEELRSELNNSTFRKIVDRQTRTANKNAAGMRAFINGVFRQRGKVLAIRIDVGYSHDPDDASVHWEPPPDEVVKKQMASLVLSIKRNVPGKAKVVWKLEWGAAKGHHGHLLILCRGSEVRQGITWGRKIGEKWLKITGGAGCYWNCNANEKLFQSLGRRGIGLINYTDEVGRRNLMNVAMYIVKADMYARFISPSIRRTFGKSQLKEKKGGKRRGRPRKYAEAG